EAGQGSYTGALDDDNVNMTVDFCFTQARVALGNFIWVDDGTQNGRFDTGETPLDGVTVQLYTSAQTPGVDTPVASTTTAGGGFYLFDNLAPGSYIVHLPVVNFSGPLSGYASCSGAGGDNANDDNVDENGQDTLDNGGISTLPINALPDSEPTGEAGQGGYTGSLDDDNVNMTIDFCVAVGVPVTPTPGPSGQPSIADPAIVKLVDPAFAQPNETVVWTITVSNPSGVTLNNVGFTDHVDDRLEILGTSATEGTVSASGQTVTFLIGSLAPNQVVTITVTTRIRSDAQVPFIIDNSATLGNPGDAYNGSSSARLLSVQSLPATGETPAWRAPLMMILVLTMGTGMVIYLNR
ncbi:MAG: DUF11 domain-containing protein, partial [Anaerolineae bacterium]|nr:DUF11 domain-containing protein [Anaerolineae bacterium]